MNETTKEEQEKYAESKQAAADREAGVDRPGQQVPLGVGGHAPLDSANLKYPTVGEEKVPLTEAEVKTAEGEGKPIEGEPGHENVIETVTDTPNEPATTEVKRIMDPSDPNYGKPVAESPNENQD